MFYSKSGAKKAAIQKPVKLTANGRRRAQMSAEKQSRAQKRAGERGRAKGM